MNYIHTIEVGGEQYRLRDLSVIDDASVAPEKTWSAQKLTALVGDLDTALDALLVIQNSLLGGDGQ